jgi:hypothetical protein
MKILKMKIIFNPTLTLIKYAIGYIAWVNNTLEIVIMGIKLSALKLKDYEQ